MSISTTTNKRYALCKTKDYRSYQGLSCTTADVYANKLVAVETVQKRSKESRVRPDPLILSPTLQQKVYVTRYRPVQYETGTWIRSGNCEFKYRYYAELPPASYLTYATVPEPEDWATKIRLRIKDESVSLGESVFEFRETADMFSAAAHLARDAWTTYRKGAFRYFKKRFLTIHDVAAAELVASFGINPALGLLYDSITKLQDRLVAPVYRFYRETVGDKTVSNFVHSSQWKGNMRIEWTRVRRAQFLVRFKADNPDFTMGNPAEVLWELVPFSWLVDGLIDIGGYLSSLDALLGVEEVLGTVSEKDKVRMVGAICPIGNYAVRVPATGSYVSHKRAVYPDIPRPAFPKWSPSRSWHKIMHATSILVMGRRHGYAVSNRPFHQSRPIY
jgi:hypothetical protein